MRRTCLAATALLLVCSQIALVTLAPAYAGPKPGSITAVLPLILWLAVPAAVAFAVAPSLCNAPPSRSAILAMIATGLAMRVVWFGTPAPLEDDYYRYLWDGALVANGLNPYTAAPSEILITPQLLPRLSELRTAGMGILANINFPNLTTVYPGGAELVFGLAHKVAPWRLDGLRLVLLLADITATALLAITLERTGRSPVLAALYWLNPLVVAATTATAHIDGLLPPLLLGVPLALTASRPRVAALCLGLAISIKVWPFLLAPMLLTHIGRSRGPLASATLILAAISLLATGPLLASLMQPSSGFAAYAGTWSNNNGPYAWASYGLYLAAGENSAVQSTLRLAVATMAVAVAMSHAVRPLAGLADALHRSTVVTAAFFYLSPAQFPWYALGFLPFAAATNNRPLLFASVTLPAYYLFFPFWDSGRGSQFLYGYAFIHSVPVWAWLAWRALTSSSETTPRVSACSKDQHV